MGNYNIAILRNSRDVRIVVCIGLIVLLPLIASSLMWREKQKEISIATIVLFFVFLLIYFTTPLWSSVASQGTGETPKEPPQLYRITIDKTYSLDKILDLIQRSNGNDIRIWSYTNKDDGTTDVQFTATGLRKMDAFVTFKKPETREKPKFTVVGDSLGIENLVSFGKNATSASRLYVYLLNGIKINMSNEVIGSYFYGQLPPVPLGSEPGFLDVPESLIIVDTLPENYSGFELRIEPLGNMKGSGALSIKINDTWYKLYTNIYEKGMYYTKLIPTVSNEKIIGVSLQTSYLQALNSDFSCICNDFNKDGDIQITYAPSVEGNVPMGNCQLSTAFDSLQISEYLQNAANLDFNSENSILKSITKDQIKTICPTYYQKCEDDPECKYESMDDICKSDPTSCVPMKMGSYDWGGDPDIAAGATSKEKLERCIDLKVKNRIKNTPKCEITKKYYSDCKLSTNILNAKSDTYLGIFFIKNLLEPICMERKIGLGSEEDFRKYFTNEQNTDLINFDPMGQLTKHCCGSP